MYYFSSFYERKPNELEQIEYNKTNLNDSTKNINPTSRKLLNNFDGKKKTLLSEKVKLQPPRAVFEQDKGKEGLKQVIINSAQDNNIWSKERHGELEYLSKKS